MRQTMLAQEQDERVGSYEYLRAYNFLSIIKKSKTLTPKQKQELWGQAVHGDLDGAFRSYEKMTRV